MAGNVSAQQVYDYVKNQIIKKQLFPGTQIIEEDLAFAMQTSRATVRKALTRLHYEGLADMIPNRGAYVAKPTPADMKNVYALRRILEVEALRTALPNINQTHIQKLENSIATQQELTKHFSVEEYIRVNAEFHWIIIEAAQNEYLNKFLLELFNKSAIFLTFYDSSSDNSDSIHTHEQLLAAIKAKDLDAAIKALEADIVCAVDCISLQ